MGPATAPFIFSGRIRCTPGTNSSRKKNPRRVMMFIKRRNTCRSCILNFNAVRRKTSRRLMKNNLTVCHSPVIPKIKAAVQSSSPVTSRLLSDTKTWESNAMRNRQEFPRLTASALARTAAASLFRATVLIFRALKKGSKGEKITLIRRPT